MRSVSVLIPVRGARPYVEPALAWVRRQTFQDSEMVCVDDGSTDGSGEDLDAAPATDGRFRILHPGKIGLVPSLNLPREVACSPLLGRRDADDVTHARRLELQLRLLNDRPQVDVVSCIVRHFLGTAVRGARRIYKDGLDSLVEPDEIDRDFLVVDLAPGSVLQFDKPSLPPARPRGEITVLLSDGSPADVDSCRLLCRAPWFYDRDDMTGVPGAHFRIRTIHPGGGFRATRYGRLEGAGPWSVRLGSAALRVTVTLPEDDDGEDRVLYVDGEVFQLESDPTAVVTGLLPGPHTVLVGAPGRVGRAMRVVLKEAETREIRVRLPRR